MPQPGNVLFHRLDDAAGVGSGVVEIPVLGHPMVFKIPFGLVNLDFQLMNPCK